MTVCYQYIDLSISFWLITILCTTILSYVIFFKSKPSLDSRKTKWITFTILLITILAINVSLLGTQNNCDDMTKSYVVSDFATNIDSESQAKSLMIPHIESDIEHFSVFYFYPGAANETQAKEYLEKDLQSIRYVSESDFQVQFKGEGYHVSIGVYCYKLNTDGKLYSGYCIK